MDQSFEMTVRSDIREITAVSARLEDAMGAAGFLPDEILDTQLAVEEVITNIIVHGYKKTGCDIHLSCRFIPGGVRIQVADSAPRFDPLSIPEPELEGDIDERQIGGLGVFLLRQVMDDISYRYEKGKNILTLKKRKAS
jgi:anti-sigma regulatory factor (Ser/Thr protein kinase)